MPRHGFIHQPLDIKLLVLYIMSRVAAPIDFDTLTDLALCDEGVDYFLYAQAVDQLITSEHLVKDDEGYYSITQKGRTNGGVMESSLPSVVRGRCDRALAHLNTTLRRNAQITAQVTQDSPERCQVELGLSDDLGPLFDLRLTVPSASQGQSIAQRFHQCPEDYFNAILACLLQGPGGQDPEEEE